MGLGRFLVLRLSDGSRMRGLRRWTDADGDARTPDGSPLEDSVFTEDSLRELMVVVDALLQRD